MLLVFVYIVTGFFVSSNLCLLIESSKYLVIDFIEIVNVTC